MAKRKPLLSDFTQFLDEQDLDGAADWLAALEKNYKTRRKNNSITDEYEEELKTLYYVMESIVDDSGKMPKFVEEIITSCSWAKFARKEVDKERISEAEKAVNRLDEIEKEEFEELYNELWNFDARKVIASEFYDWNEDAEVHMEIEVPRKLTAITESNFKYGLKTVLSTILYNRGTTLVLAYMPKNSFELYGIKFDEDGHWIPMHQSELKEMMSIDYAKEVFEINGKLTYSSFKRKSPLPTGKELGKVLKFNPSSKSILQ